jgi:hypothetical protein
LLTALLTTVLYLQMVGPVEQEGLAEALPQTTSRAVVAVVAVVAEA